MTVFTTHPPEFFLKNLLSGTPQRIVEALRRRAIRFAAEPPFNKLDRESRLQAIAWEEFVADLFRAYQKTALRKDRWRQQRMKRP